MKFADLASWKWKWKYHFLQFCEKIGIRKRWSRGGHSPTTDTWWIWDKDYKIDNQMYALLAWVSGLIISLHIIILIIVV